MIWASFVSIFRKEFLHIFRDRATLVAALMIPIFQLILFGFIDQSVKNLPTVVVDQDNTQHSRELMDRLRATKTFRIVHVTPDPRRARDEIVSGKVRVGISIPPDYHDLRARGLPAKVLVLIDGSDSSVSAQALAAVSGLAADVSLQEITKNAPNAAMPLSAQPVILFNPEGRTANYIIPGLIAILLQIVAVVLTAMAIVREREKGTLEQLLVTPIHPLGLMLGKLAPYLVLGLVEAAIVLFAMRFGFSVPIRGNLIFLFAMALVYLFALLSLGLLISTRAPSQAAAMQQAQMLLLPSIFLSGYIFPASGLPLPLWAIGRVLPATHMVEIMRGVVLRDAGPRDLWQNVAALVALSVVLVWLSVKRFQKVAI
ncbi:MAG: ABC transporter permease [Polyangiaceae bacterium]